MRSQVAKAQIEMESTHMPQETADRLGQNLPSDEAVSLRRTRQEEDNPCVKQEPIAIEGNN